jgi:hypothetical protein
LRKARLSQIAAEGMRAMGAAGVLFMAAGFNFALYPDALAQVLPASIVSMADPAPVAPGLVLDEADVRLVAATCWGEARSEGEQGMRAVAHVIVNRVGDRFGGDIESVVRSPWQFSVWNRRDPNRRRVENPEAYATEGADQETWEIAQRIAREVLSGQSTDPTNGALFYHTTSIRPWWARWGQGRRVIGAHVFYADVRRGGARSEPIVIALPDQNSTEEPPPLTGVASAPLPPDPLQLPQAAPTDPALSRVQPVEPQPVS